ncbi:MAG TPA: tripartite tricarboxylate transporter substrate binding protein [Burkholderiales bacterium]|nr:tripartite tricarboxylate transporter substrate binding protein [Burkholderiales bacterium]
MKSGLLWIALLVAGGVDVAWSQPYPAKPVRLIVTYPAGGGTDITARLVAQKLSESLGRNVIVDNRTGGGGIVGTDAIAKAAPDGYTIGMATPSPITIGKTLFSSLPYDPLRDLAPVILVNESASVLVVHPSVPARSVKELVALAKARSLNVAINNLASVHHLLTEMFNHTAGITMNDVPYKGGGLAATDLVGGQVELLWSVLPIVLPFIQNGRLRALAVASEKRSALLPDVPTMGESGWPSIVGSGWNGIVTPAGTPRNIIERLNAEITRTLNAPDVKERFTTLGFEALGSTPDEFGAFMRAETVKWAEVIRTAKIKID